MGVCLAGTDDRPITTPEPVMNTRERHPEETTIPARDGFPLAARVYRNAPDVRRAVIVSSATAVPQSFYRHYAAGLADAGYAVVTYDYRGIGGSRPASLSGFGARMRDWALLDMAAVVDWTQTRFAPERTFMIGHSVGGQVAGLLDNTRHIDAMITLSAQSGHWRLQGGLQKPAVALHVYVSLPLLSHLLGYMPWSWVGSAEDLPKHVALEWSGWCRKRNYLLDDDTLPLDRYQRFDAPVLAYSFDDDNWGTARAVDAMMSAYPNLERRHAVPTDYGLEAIGHFGYFRPQAKALWSEGLAWLEALD